MDVGVMALLAICKEQDVYSFFRAKLTEDHFATDMEKQLYGFVIDHVTKFHTLPHVTTIGEGLDKVPVVEPVEYYLAQVDERWTHRKLNKGLYDLSALVGEHKYDDALKGMEKLYGSILENKMRQQMVEFGKDALMMVQAEYNKKLLLGDDYAVLFGWPYLDKMVSGLLPGDVVAYVGRPAVGKTWKILYSAHHAWWRQKKNVLVLSMEMAILALCQRVTAMHSHVNISQLKMAELTKKGQQKWHTAMAKADGHPSKLWIVDGNLTSTPAEIFALVSQLKPDVVFIDGAYLLRHENPKLDRYTRVAENIEAIKKMTSRANIPTVCSYQFNRMASKKKDEAVGLEDIGYSDAIGQIASIVLGLFEDESVETMKQRKVHVLKGRDGATGHFSVKWDFQFMDFSEVLDSEKDVSSLEYC